MFNTVTRSAAVFTLVAAMGAALAPPAFAGHDGPAYTLPSGAYAANSRTFDTARGPDMTVEWTDRLNQRHKVTIGRNESVTVVFPVAAGDWSWRQSSARKISAPASTSR